MKLLDKYLAQPVRETVPDPKFPPKTQVIVERDRPDRLFHGCVGWVLSTHDMGAGRMVRMVTPIRAGRKTRVFWAFEKDVRPTYDQPHFTLVVA